MNEEDNSILSKEQAEDIRSKHLTPAQRLAKKKRDADAKRKREERGREKDRKEMQSIASKEALWERNRKLLSESELTDLLEKQERVWDQLHWMHEMMGGNDDPTDTECYVGLEEGTADLFAHVKERGVVTMELVLLGEYWKDADLYQRFQGSDPDSIFARLGLVTALPSHSVHQWEQFLATTTTPIATAPPPSSK